MPLLASTDPAWAGLLARAPHDFYARPDVVGIEAGWMRADAKALAFDDLVMPLLVRHVPASLGQAAYDAVSPYGYPGVVALDAARAAETLLQLPHAGAEAGLVASFVRLHPVLNQGLGEALEGAPGLHVVPTGTTVGLTLEADEAMWLASIGQTARYELRQLRKQGYGVRMNHPEDTAVFAALYRSTMQRIGAPEMYLYDDAYLHGMVDALGERASVWVVETPQGEAACAGLFVHTGDIVQYHLSGSDERFRRNSPTRLMIAEARRWARSRGASLLHLGGGVGGREDSLFAFKRALGDVVFPYMTLRVVHDRARYEALLRARHRLAPLPEPTTFFPAYRHP